MSDLISGKEAKLAWAKGEVVLYRSGDKVWRNLNDTDFYSSIFENKLYEFCLKPRTIYLNGIEVPAPFEPKSGDTVFALDNANPDGFSSFVFDSDFFTINFGAWRTEDEIKQVVVALRSVFNVK